MNVTLGHKLKCTLGKCTSSLTLLMWELNGHGPASLTHVVRSIGRRTLKESETQFIRRGLRVLMCCSVFA